MCAQNEFCAHTGQATLGRFAPVTFLPFSVHSGLRPETRISSAGTLCPANLQNCWRLEAHDR